MAGKYFIGKRQRVHYFTFKMSLRFFCVLQFFLTVSICSLEASHQVNSGYHHNNQYVVTNDKFHVHPFQAMVLRATDFSPVIFYGEHGRVHMEYRPIWPKVAYTVGVISELMRGVGLTVSEILHRAAEAYPGPHYGDLLDHPLYHAHGHHHLPSHHTYQTSSLADYRPHADTGAYKANQNEEYHVIHNYQQHPEQRSSQKTTPQPTEPRKPPILPLPIMPASTHVRPRYMNPPLFPRPPSKPEENVLEVLSKVIVGA